MRGIEAIGARVARDLSTHSRGSRELTAATATIEELLPAVENLVDEARAPFQEMLRGMDKRRAMVWFAEGSGSKMEKDWIKPSRVAQPAAAANDAFAGIAELTATISRVATQSGDDQLRASTAVLDKAVKTLEQGTGYLRDLARRHEAGARSRVFYDRSARPFDTDVSRPVRSVAKDRFVELERSVEHLRRDVRSAEYAGAHREGMRASIAEQRAAALERYEEQRRALQLVEG